MLTAEAVKSGIVVSVMVMVGRVVVGDGCHRGTPSAVMLVDSTVNLPSSLEGQEVTSAAMRIGEVGAATGVTTKTLRFYESIGLVPEPLAPPRATATIRPRWPTGSASFAKHRPPG